MRNLLTLSFKSRLRQEYLLRLAAVSGWMLVIAMVMGVLALLPAYLLSRTNLDARSAEYERLQASVASLTTGTSGAPITLLKQKLEVLAAERDDQRLTEALLTILVHRGESVGITSFNYAKGATETVLKLRGVAADRDSLLAFQKALQLDGRFSKVELPVSNLAQEKDIEFDITLTGAF